VGRYPANKLMDREPLPKRKTFPLLVMRHVEGIRY